MIWLALALTGAIGAVGGYLAQVWVFDGSPARLSLPLLFDVLASAGLGLIAGGLLFAIFGSDSIGPISSGMLFAYLGGAGIPLVLRLVEARDTVSWREIFESGSAIALGFASLAGGLALAAQIS